jgi:hypothetical protein
MNCSVIHATLIYSDIFETQIYQLRYMEDLLIFYSWQKALNH